MVVQGLNVFLGARVGVLVRLYGGSQSVRAFWRFTGFSAWGLGEKFRVYGLRHTVQGFRLSVDAVTASGLKAPAPWLNLLPSTLGPMSTQPPALEP